MKKQRPIRTAEGTYFVLKRQDEFQKFFRGLIEYLQKKLKRVEVEEGRYYYTCGQPHTRFRQSWESFPHFWNYTEKMGFDFYAVKDLIDEFFHRELEFECKILCGNKKIRRRELERAGVFFGENPGRRRRRSRFRRALQRPSAGDQKPQGCGRDQRRERGS